MGWNKNSVGHHKPKEDGGIYGSNRQSRPRGRRSQFNTRQLSYPVIIWYPGRRRERLLNYTWAGSPLVGNHNEQVGCWYLLDILLGGISIILLGLVYTRSRQGEGRVRLPGRRCSGLIAI